METTAMNRFAFNLLVHGSVLALVIAIGCLTKEKPEQPAEPKTAEAPELQPPGKQRKPARTTNIANLKLPFAPSPEAEQPAQAAPPEKKAGAPNPEEPQPPPKEEKPAAAPPGATAPTVLEEAKDIAADEAVRRQEKRLKARQLLDQADEMRDQGNWEGAV